MPGSLSQGPRQSRVTWGMAQGLLLALFLLLVSRPGVLGPLSNPLEWSTLDLWSSLRQARPSHSVVVLRVDEATVRRWNGRTFDAPDIARALRQLRRHGARAVALDFPTLCDAQGQLPGRADLIAAIKENGRVTLPFEFRRRPHFVVVPLMPRALKRFTLAPVDDDEEPQTSAPRLNDVALRAPASDLLEVAAGAGHLSFDFDRFGRARRLPLGIGYRGRMFPAFALSTANVAGMAPSLSDGMLLLNYPRATSEGDEAIEGDEARLPLDCVSLSAALSDDHLWNEFAGKVVVMGITAPGMGAGFPLPGGGRASECELMAFSLDNLIGGHALRRAPTLWHWLFTLLPCLVVGGLSVAWRPAWSALVAFLCGLIVAMVSLGLFARGLWLDASVPWTAIGATCLVGVGGYLRRREHENVSIASTMDALAQVAEIVAVGKTPDELLERVVAFAAKTMRAGGASAFLLDEARGELRIVAAIGPGSAPLLGQRLGVGEGIAGRIARDGCPLRVPDVPSESAHASRFDLLTGLETRSVLGVPLKNRGAVVGVLEVVNREGDVPFSDADLELLGAIANQAAVALDNVRLYDRLALRVEQSQDALTDANRELQSDKTLMQTVLHSMTDGVVVTDEQGRIQLVNAAAALLFPELGHNRLGEPLAQVLPDFPLGAIPRGRSELHAPQHQPHGEKAGLNGSSSHALLAPPGASPPVPVQSNGSSLDAPPMPLEDGRPQREENLREGAVLAPVSPALHAAQETMLVRASGEVAPRTTEFSPAHFEPLRQEATPFETGAQTPKLAPFPAHGTSSHQSAALVPTQTPISAQDAALPPVSDQIALEHAAPAQENSAVQGEENERSVLLFRGSSEAPLAIEGHVAPLRGEDGELAGLVAVFADVTQRREIEQAKSDFVSFVAHEMRSPLTSISGFSAMLQRGEGGHSALSAPTRARFLGLIHGESQRLTRLINTLLDVARLEAGRTIELNRDLVELEPLALLALENQRAYSSRHVLKADFASSLPPVFADADKVLQILINLLSNAQKYSSGGDIVLGARALDGAVEMWVSDQGPGIAPEQRALLFSRFGRAPQSAQGIGARAKPTGTGLGLFLTKHLVEAHGGRIWVESQAGHGATFRFTLPCEDAVPLDFERASGRNVNP